MTTAHVADVVFNSDAPARGQPSQPIRAENRLDSDSATRAEGPILRNNKGRALDDVERELRAYEAQFQQDPFPATEIRIKGDRLFAGARELSLDENGKKRLCQRLGAPTVYLERLGNALRTQILQYHLNAGLFADQRLHAGNSQIVRRGDVFADLNRDDLYVLGCADVFQALKDGVGDDGSDLYVQSLIITDERIEIDLLSPRRSHEVRVGDVVRGGIHLEHSLFGEQATLVETHIQRLVCRNGLVHRECVNQARGPRTRRLETSHANARELQIDQIRRLVNQTWNGLSPKLHGISTLADQAVDAPAMLEQFLRRGRLHSRFVMEQLRNAWQVEGAEETQFGVLNALTRVATHSTVLTARQRRTLAHLAGIFAHHRTHICPRCFSITVAT